MRVDKFSMAHSLEARAPFLDHTLATYALSLPAGLSGDGLPLGLHLIGRAFDEATVLRAARTIVTFDARMVAAARVIGGLDVASA